jgi:hypothetical protein
MEPVQVRTGVQIVEKSLVVQVFDLAKRAERPGFAWGPGLWPGPVPDSGKGAFLSWTVPVRVRERSMKERRKK